MGCLQLGVVLCLWMLRSGLGCGYNFDVLSLTGVVTFWVRCGWYRVGVLWDFIFLVGCVMLYFG